MVGNGEVGWQEKGVEEREEKGEDWQEGEEKKEEMAGKQRKVRKAIGFYNSLSRGICIQVAVKANSQSNQKGQMSSPPGSKPSEHISMKLEMYNYVGVSPHMQIHMALQEHA